MFMSYKPAVLRPELIRLREILRKGVNISVAHLEEVETRKGGLFSSLFGKPKPEFSISSMSFGLMSGMMDKKLGTMIEMCDEAHEKEASIFVDDQDLMFLNQLRKLESTVKAGPNG